MALIVISGELVVCGYQPEPLIGTDWITPHPDPWMSGLADLTDLQRACPVRKASTTNHSEQTPAWDELREPAAVVRPLLLSESAGINRHGMEMKGLYIEGVAIHRTSVRGSSYSARPAPADR